MGQNFPNSPSGARSTSPVMKRGRRKSFSTGFFKPSASLAEGLKKPVEKDLRLPLFITGDVLLAPLGEFGKFCPIGHGGRVCAGNHATSMPAYIKILCA